MLRLSENSHFKMVAVQKVLLFCYFLMKAKIDLLSTLRNALNSSTRLLLSYFLCNYLLQNHNEPSQLKYFVNDFTWSGYTNYYCSP